MHTEPTGEFPDWAREIISSLDEKMGLQFTHLSAERAEGSMPVEGNTQPFGMWHGGASGVLIESLASMAAACAGYPDQFGVGVDLNVSHLAPARSGRVKGVAQLLRRGQRTLCYEVRLTDDNNNLVAIGRLTCQLVQARRPG